jgi:hypothetical protein
MLAGMMPYGARLMKVVVLVILSVLVYYIATRTIWEAVILHH